MSSFSFDALRTELRSDVNRFGKCAGIRAFAIAHPDLSVALLVSIGNMAGLSPSTVRIQTAQARAGLSTLVAKGPEAAPTVKKSVAAVTKSNYDHRAACLDEIERCKKIAKAKWGVCPQPRVIWAKRGTTAGTALGSTQINLNEFMAAAEGEKFTKRTPGHEYAHCVVAALKTHCEDAAVNMRALGRILGRRFKSDSTWAPHGTKWQAVMHSFGLAATRCHNYESAAVAQTRTTRVCKANCGCDKLHMITRNMHNKIVAGAKYKCRLCRTILTV